ncbi:transposase [Shigella boydii]|nr:transposase [Shigella flexneri CCH060]OEG43000.1 hypothetical protein BHQ38_22585 [Shigella sp. FC2710]OXW84555.1 transposase [Shigella boydii]PHU95283.1 transposase [Shigella boydii]
MRAEIALMSGSAFAVTHHAFSSGAGRTSDGNGSHASTLKSPSYTKSVSWQHYPWFESSKAIMAESFATGSDHQVVNELNGERLREPNEVFKRLGRAIRYNFQVDDAKFRRDNVKEIISTLFANKVDVDHPENKYKDFKDLEDKVEKRLQNRQTEYQNEINQLSAPGVNFDDI